MALLLWLLVGLPAATGLALLAAGRRADRIAAPLAVGAAAAAVGLGAAAAVMRPSVSTPMLPGVPAGLAVDGLSAVMVVVVPGILLAVALFAAGDIGAGQARARFHGLLLVFAAAMLVTVTATDLLALLAGWEVMGATSYALIAYWWSDRARVRSATLAFVTTRAADLGLYLAAGAALAGGAAALDIAALPDLSGAWRGIAVAGLVVAALGKSAQLPFSFWLSHAMAGPSPVSAMLHSATMVAAGGYLLLRVRPSLEAVAWAGPAVAWIGVLTALVLGVVALAQSDLKQLLAASTCSQIGFIVLAAGAGAIAGGTLQFTAHATVKSLLFLAAGAWLAALGTEHLADLRGAARRYPLVGAAFSVGALTLGGLPPLSIWVAKDEILAAALARSPVLYAVGLAAAAVSAAYAAKALFTVWARPAAGPAAEGAGPGPAGLSPLHRLPLPVLAAGAVGLAALALPPVASWWRRVLGASAEHGPAAWETALSAAVSVAVVAAVGWALRRPAAERPSASGSAARWVGGWLWLERVALGGVAAPTMALARGLAAFDDRVVAGAVRSGAAGGVRLALLTDARTEAGVEGAVRAVAAGARALGGWARRPQTGLLHQYYAQAVVALAVLAAVFILMR
ncbi:NADH:ubiquinone oxidoreductase subunit 5 (subunit L)/multisubunit Na+/H+ antiporter MnhA subunit [Spinactinospora alkalitolerans]|uniref:NADH:ubiquinone oxidoreductase subunit 5 (Subunit L)/multisubunit Na+/H+ antiporter MnhA subunit n=1 Tax=Spinactinospora alkalitolerans TaxID=687207 RepID=A0A852TYS5_9ACTN|nr:proton-conducting transporter membrane subunit [Spinactinospora alkalitolerans]NYE48447.1 NADH:ubiquinone oxidoreductase subunit 5 (subunit L)/multisubunit Na+/H+ antiporter MnhA subunit [Spinactinospora alkalitolerans]